MTFRTKLLESIPLAARVNRGVQITPAVILWTDKDRQWESIIKSLMVVMPELFIFGPYSVDDRCGPAIWLKFAISKFSQNNLAVPVIYLPGIGRSDLRDIESSARELQPLAELQYRGVYWSQVNGKDWTINAFLTSKTNGLGLDIVQDKLTQIALHRVLEAGELLDRPISDLQGRQINAEWLDSLLAPNPIRDILFWLNDPDFIREKWGDGRWSVFMSRCKKDFGFDPITDGEMIASEKLALKAGAWKEVWSQYKDSFQSFPKIIDKLERISPPASFGLFDDTSGFPKVNVEQELLLSSKLEALDDVAPNVAREAIIKLEEEHGPRREWVWARMGRSPLAIAMAHLANIADLSRKIPGGVNPDEMAEHYKNGAWKVDAEAMLALASVKTKADTKAVCSVLRSIYVSWLEASAFRLQQLVVDQGGLSKEKPKLVSADEGLCFIFVDGLRYDVAVELNRRLTDIGATSLSGKWTSLPSVTASGKAWASPIASFIGGNSVDADFEPSIASDSKPLNSYNFRKLLNENGYQTLGSHENGDPTGKAWVECGDLDHYGHEHGLRLARDLNGQLEQIMERVHELKDAGWRQFRIVTDHGWLLVPGGLPKSELSKFETQTRWGRCAVLKDSSHGTHLTFGWDWCKDVQIAMAPGISNFIAGAEYAHGGISLQECLVPIIDVKVAAAEHVQMNIEFSKVSWRGLRCNIEVSSALTGLRVDIRTKAALAKSTIASSVKAIIDGKASLAIEDDSLAGVSAVIVILDVTGSVIQKISTTIGESA